MLGIVLLLLKEKNIHQVGCHSKISAVTKGKAEVAP